MLTMKVSECNLYKYWRLEQKSDALNDLESCSHSDGEEKGRRGRLQGA